MIDLAWQKTITLKSGKSVVLRYPRLDDAERLMYFINPIIEENTFIMATQTKSVADEVEYITSCVDKIKAENSLYIYAVDENTIVGAIDIRRKPEKMSHVGLLGIMVAKDFRGDGLGRALMQEAIAQAKDLLGLKIVKLGCFANNTGAIQLYKSLGFQEYGRLPQGLLHRGEYVDHLDFYLNI